VFVGGLPVKHDDGEHPLGPTSDRVDERR
jgi:hypothetical protein